MAAMTQYVYRSDDAWVLKKDGRASRTFETQREAIAWAIKNGVKKKPAQIVVFGKSGQVVEHKRYGVMKIQKPVKKGRLDPKQITMAVNSVVLERLRSTDGQTTKI